ncbi:NADP-dependent oxidoreductase [Streptomyces sp. NPDC001732]
MQAIVFEEFGGPEVLHLEERADPRPGPGQVRVTVRAAGVNPVDHKIRSGAMEEVFPTALPATPGGEFSGVVAEVGDGVTGIAVGDEVLGWSATGAYATSVLADTNAITPKPAGLSWENAAALPIVTETAARVLDALEVGDGDTLLLHGAAGGVGSAGVQLALARGATVIGTASPGNHAYLRELGAIPVAYGEGLVARVREVAPQGVDAVFDAAGRGVLPDSIELRGGTTDRIVTIADADAAKYGVAFSGGRLARTNGGLAKYARAATEGRLTIPVARTFPLGEAAKAHELSEEGHVRGKLVLLP